MSRSKVVFVGNIPYEMTEEQIIDIMKEVGPVHSFKLMFDRETGRSRGYGFCEYADPETAASALRNCTILVVATVFCSSLLVNGYAVGDRQLRVDKADQEFPSQMASSTIGQSQSQPQSQAQPQPIQFSSVATPSIEAISAVLSAMTNPQMLEVLAQIKTMATASPEQTRQLLASNPALAYALLQALMGMGLVDPMMVQRIVQSVPATAPVVDQPTPPVGSQPVSAEQQRALISQIMGLTMEQIDALPAQQREQVLQLVSPLSCPIRSTHITDTCRDRN